MLFVFLIYAIVVSLLASSLYLYRQTGRRFYLYFIALGLILLVVSSVIVIYLMAQAYNS
ncbi:hypothetical protein SAMN04487985_10453 [Aerococcus urinaehominis]|uniref:hypothetical protein n=1 Tax=Aerococcus urinaehominis TaxID=128944 RepID=UPI00088D71F8|nr:hypothetical protein [Aerococcus urinaehominis]SDM04301.1 hypothetical protein SAMN04487985_10453 [Aerococcus urinaehominis]